VVIAEFDWLLNEERGQQYSERELRAARRQIKELEEQKQKLQVAINIAREIKMSSIYVSKKTKEWLDKFIINPELALNLVVQINSKAPIKP